MRYHAVLNSHRWRRLKWRRLILAGFRCENCDAAYVGRSPKTAMRYFELHHVNYARLGGERLDDVRALCPACHGVVIHDRLPV